VVLYYLFVAMYVYGRTLPTVLQYCTYYKDKKGTKGLYTYRETADSFFKA